ncbi:hypothetical protein KCMC57_up14910 [Kitasatospora sp. CMC57]|uniref:Amino acid permease n=1 Tax=Kitasatospora sp. CMC57 TaxID=3231513 RepID=A0AB33JUI2_9ACTN
MFALRFARGRRELLGSVHPSPGQWELHNYSTVSGEHDDLADGVFGVVGFHRHRDNAAVMAPERCTAFAAGCSALTGVEAIANAVPTFRTPGVRRAQRTEVALGALLGVMLVGLAVLIGRFHLQPVDGVTVLAQLADASLGHGCGFYLVQCATVVLLALAANTSFGGMPVLLHLLARDNTCRMSSRCMPTGRCTGTACCSSRRSPRRCWSAPAAT